jgi:hypothetical protein
MATAQKGEKEMKRITRIALPFFYFVITSGGHFVQELQFSSSKQCYINEQAYITILTPNDQVSECFNSTTGQPVGQNINN